MPSRKLTAEQVAAIRDVWDSGVVRSLEQLGAKYGVSNSTIAAIVKRQIWKDETKRGPVLKPNNAISKSASR